MSEEALQIYSDSYAKTQLYLASAFRVYSELTPSSHTNLSNDDTVTIDDIPRIFAQMVEATTTEAHREQASYGICHGMMILANRHPTLIDAFLEIYIQAVTLLLHRDHDWYRCLLGQLTMMMGETAHTGYRTNGGYKLSGAFRPGDDDPANASNVIFTRSEVDDHLGFVFKVIRLQAQEGNDYVVRAAMYARWSYFMVTKNPQWLTWRWEVDDYGIDEHLKKDFGRVAWVKEDLLAALIRLRGYAKCLAEEFAKREKTKGKMQECQGLLKRWLWDPELDTTRDLGVKYHVMLALKNLQEGPWDETSEQLFKAQDWVF